MPETPSVLFVCLGNICRSPLAEAAFRQACAREGVDIACDSAGTGSWHIGEPPDPRAQAVARAHGAEIAGYRARQASALDFHRFSHVLALDSENLKTLRRLQPADGRAELSLLLDFVPGRRGQSVADPWFGGPEGFEDTWADVSQGAEALLARLTAT